MAPGARGTRSRKPVAETKNQKPPARAKALASRGRKHRRHPSRKRQPTARKHAARATWKAPPPPGPAHEQTEPRSRERQTAEAHTGCSKPKQAKQETGVKAAQGHQSACLPRKRKRRKNTQVRRKNTPESDLEAKNSQKKRGHKPTVTRSAPRKPETGAKANRKTRRQTAGNRTAKSGQARTVGSDRRPETVAQAETRRRPPETRPPKPQGPPGVEAGRQTGVEQGCRDGPAGTPRGQVPKPRGRQGSRSKPAARWRDR